jgi:hypothetical protein
VTRSNYDKEVSALLGAIVENEGYEAKNLAQWRSKHQTDIDRMGSTLVNPLSKPVPRT